MNVNEKANFKELKKGRKSQCPLGIGSFQKEKYELSKNILFIVDKVIASVVEIQINSTVCNKTYFRKAIVFPYFSSELVFFPVYYTFS